MTEYSLADAARLFKIPPARLRHWQRTAILNAPGKESPPTAFDFRDLVGIKSLLSLLEQGVPLRRIRKTVEGTRQMLPDLERPLDALRILHEGSNRLVMRHRGELLEPDGQMILDFDAGQPAVMTLPRASGRGREPARKPSHAGPGLGGQPGPRNAVQWFERGCRLDVSPETVKAAEECYERAIAMDPNLADAHCNLGTLHYNVGRRAEARIAYERAVEAEPNHVEANFNLANLLDEDGSAEAALHHYGVALRADPFYADLHLNLALLHERLDSRDRALGHWRRYLQLVPTGHWADVARDRLKGKA